MLKYLSRMRLKKMQKGGSARGDPGPGKAPFVKTCVKPQVTRELGARKRVDSNQGGKRSKRENFHP
ncbi:MAG: hypothetical protein CM15mV74_010 [uncultured marine virus]|nr:MAG: hypothetical protein CM15mV74_010 [uncultured marine virus]